MTTHIDSRETSEVAFLSNHHRELIVTTCHQQVDMITQISLSRFIIIVIQINDE